MSRRCLTCAFNTCNLRHPSRHQPHPRLDALCSCGGDANQRHSNSRTSMALVSSVAQLKVKPHSVGTKKSRGHELVPPVADGLRGRNRTKPGVRGRPCACSSTLAHLRSTLGRDDLARRNSRNAWRVRRPFSYAAFGDGAQPSRQCDRQMDRGLPVGRRAAERFSGLS